MAGPAVAASKNSAPVFCMVFALGVRGCAWKEDEEKTQSVTRLGANHRTGEKTGTHHTRNGKKEKKGTRETHITIIIIVVIINNKRKEREREREGRGKSG